MQSLPPRRLTRFVWILFGLTLCGHPALAQDPAPELQVPAASDTSGGELRPIALAPVTVQAPRVLTTIGGASAVAVKVDSMPLPAAPAVEQVLRELPLLHVRTNSRGEAEVSARGSESRQVAVLVDGIPITLAWDARADVSIIPATALQEVVYTRGLSSMLYGPNVLGGVLEANIGRAAAMPDHASARITSGVDDTGSYGATASATVPVPRESGDLLIRGGIGFRDAEDQPLARDVVERPTAEDGSRLNTDSKDLDGFLSLRYKAHSGSWYSLSGTAFRAERGIAAELGNDGARFWRYPEVSRVLTVAAMGTGTRPSPFGGLGGLEFSAGLDRGRTEIDSYTDETYSEIDAFEDGRDVATTFRALGSQTVGTRGSLRAAATLSNLKHEEFIPAGNSTYRQRLWSFGLENTWRLIQDGSGIHSLSLNTGGAYDVGETPEAGGRERLGRIAQGGGRIGVSLGLDRNETVLHAGASRRGRFPALRELYSGALNRFAPNPDLKPEKLTAIEAGVTRRHAAGQLQVVAFHSRVKDAIVRITLEDRRFMRVNRNELESTGLEMLAAHRLGRFDLAADFTLQSVDLTDTEADETHQPENLPEAFGSLSARFAAGAGLNIGARVDYTGHQFCIDPGTGEDAELESGALVGAHLARVWPLRPGSGGFLSRLETRLAVDNLADTALYDQCGLPMPGRRVRLELRVF